MLENRVLYNLDAIVGHSANRRTMPTSDQEDGAPHQGECEAEGGDENDGEKHTEGPTRKGSCQIKREGPRVLEGRLIRVAGNYLRAAEKHLRAAGVQLRAAEKRLQAEERYGGSANLFCITKWSYCC